MRTRVLAAVTLVALVTSAAACGSDSSRDSASLKVMTWNVYIGGDISVLLTPDSPEELGEAIAELFDQVARNSFQDRAVAIARHLAEEQPDVVGLQEVALWRTQTPADGTQSPASTVEYDQLKLLLSALKAEGADYVVASTRDGVDAEVATLSRDVRLTDRDVVLVRADSSPPITIDSSGSGTFDTNLTADSPLGPFSVSRGWASVELSIMGRGVRFVTTHLEVAPLQGIQLPQARQLIDEALASELPTVLAGDLNSAADGSQTTTYQSLRDAGFTDAWEQANPEAAGFTCCHASDLVSDDVPLARRIDLALLLGPIEAIEAHVVGSRASERSPAGRWPSDHAGLVAELLLE